MSSTAKGQREIEMRDRLRIEQSQWLSLWRDVASFCCPHKQRVVSNAYAGIGQSAPRFNAIRQSSTAIDALNVASGGCKSWLIPGGDEGWGGMWEPDPSRDKSAAVRDWLADCTARSIMPLKSGGFFTGAHEMIQDMLVFGTGGLLLDEGDENTPLACKAIEASNFVGMRDWRDEVMRVIITWSKTAAEIKDQFSLPGDTIPPRVTQDCDSNNGQAQHEFIQSIYRRSDEEREEYKENEPKGQPYASCWIHVPSKTVMRERGYLDMPFVAPRWNTWAGTGTSFYGTSPAMQAVADMKGLSLLDMVMSMRAEIEIEPRIKVMPSQSGPINLAAGGITHVNQIDGVTEWAQAGTYPVGKDQNELIARRIERAFFKDLFESVTPIAREREMNIPTMEAVQREAASRISPAISRMESDFFNQALLRVFLVLRRAGVFEEPPEDAFHQDKAGQYYLILPQVVQANRMSRVLNARKGYAFQQSMSRALSIAQVRPEVFDLYDFEKIQRDLDRGDGIPKDWVKTEEEVQQFRAAKAEAAQQQMQQQVAAQAIGNHPLDMAKIATGNIAA